MNTPEPTSIPSLHCTKCKYDLHGIDPSSKCPECGTPLLENCINCHYSLEGTPPESVCPECGLEAKYSLTQGPLLFVSEEKLKSIHKGFRIVGVSLLSFFIYPLVVIILMFVHTFYTTFTNFSETTIPNILIIIFAGIYSLAAIGWWKLSAPIKDLPRELNNDRIRYHIRQSTIVFTIVLIMLLIGYSLPKYLTDHLSYSVLYTVDVIAILMFVIVTFYAYYAQLKQFSWFAKLLKNEKAKKRSAHLIWSGPLIAIVGGLILLIMGPLITLILYATLLSRIRKDIQAIILQSTSEPALEP